MALFNFQQLTQLRTTPSPGWAKKIGGAINKLFTPDGSQPVPTGVAEDSTTGGGADGQSPLNTMPNSWKVYMDRKSVYQDLEMMDNEDELVPTALDVFANHALDHLPDSEVRMRFNSKNAEVKRILDALDRRLNLRQDIWQIGRDAGLHGNTFREVVIDRNRMQVSRFKQTVSYQISPKMNEFGDKLPGWLAQTDSEFYTGGGRELEEWQIIPIIYGAKSGFFAKPPLAAARRGFKRLSRMEDGMAVARLTRAYDRLAHHIPVKPNQSKEEILTTIRQYKDNIVKRSPSATSEGDMTRSTSPYDVDTDFFLPEDGTGRGRIDVLTSTNNQLGNLNDLNYHREKLLARLKVPISYLQIMSTQKTHLKSGSSGGDVEKEFAKELKHMQSVVRQAVRRLADIELMLHGIVPSEDLYDIELVKIETKDRAADANVMLTYSQAAAYFVEVFGVLPPEFVTERFMLLDSAQKEMLTKFFNTYGDRINKARVKKFETDAAPKPKPAIGGGSGSGNNNKSKAAASLEQSMLKAHEEEKVALEDVVDIMVQTIEGIHAGLVIDSGYEIADLPGDLDDTIRQGLLNVVQSESFVLS